MLRACIPTPVSSHAVHVSSCSRQRLPPLHAALESDGRLTNVEGGLERLRELETLNEQALLDLERTLSQHAAEDAASVSSLEALSAALSTKSDTLTELDAAAEALERELLAQEQSLRVLESVPVDVAYPDVDAVRPERWRMLAETARRRLLATSSQLDSEQQQSSAQLSPRAVAAIASRLGPGPEQLRCLQSLPLTARPDVLSAMSDAAAAAALSSAPPTFAAELLALLSPSRAASLLQRMTAVERASLISLLGWGERSALFELPPVQQEQEDGGHGTLRQGLAFAVLKVVDLLVLLR